VTETPHDAFFKAVMGRPDVARDFVFHYLPREITARLDPDFVDADPESYVDEDLKEYFSDVTVSMRLLDARPADVYFLFEHKSGPAPFARLQMLGYMVKKWSKLRAQGKLAGGSLPLVVAVLVHHGRRKWTSGPRFAELFRFPSEAFRPFAPDFEHLLHDVAGMDEERFKATVELRVFQLTLKYVFREDLRHMLPSIFELLLQLEEKEKVTEYLALLIAYVLKAGRKVTVEDVKEAAKILPRGEEAVETAAEQLRREGYELAMREKALWIREAEERGEKRGEERGEKRGEERGEKRGEERGEKRGEERGEKRGEIKGIRLMLLEALRKRFGTVPPGLAARIEAAKSLETLRSLFLFALDAPSLDEFAREADRVFGPPQDR